MAGQIEVEESQEESKKCFTNCPYVPEIKVAKPILIELNMQSH